MAKLIRVETFYYHYEVKLTENQAKRIKEGDKGFNEVYKEVSDNMKPTNSPNGTFGFVIED